MNILLEKLKINFRAILPIVLFVLLLHFTIAPIESYLLLRLIIGSVFILIGLSIFCSE
jgi:hypothetical protein